MRTGMKLTLVLAGIGVISWILCREPGLENPSETVAETEVLTPQTKPSAQAVPRTGAKARASGRIPIQESRPVLNKGAGTDFRRDFQALAEKTLDQLPRISDFRGLSAQEVHYTPVAIQEAGWKLGQVAQMLEEHPELAKEAFSFYQKCAREQEYPMPIRALCFADMGKLAASSDQKKLMRSAEYPDELRQLAAFIMEMQGNS